MIAPIASVVLFIVGIVVAVALAATATDSEAIETTMAIATSLAMLLYVAMMVIFVIDLIYAIHFMYTRHPMDEGSKRVWLILAFFFGFITVPLLYFMHLRKGN